MERYRSVRENVKMNLTCLMRVTAEEEQVVLQNQLTVLSHLWTNVHQELKEKLKVLITLIENVERFDRQYEIMCVWLNGIECSADKRCLGTSPEKQKERIKEVSFRDCCHLIMYNSRRHLWTSSNLVYWKINLIGNFHE